jgi:hypothetical protein
MSNRSRCKVLHALLVVILAALAAIASPASADQVALDDGQGDWNPACGAGCSMFAPFDIKRVTVARDAGTLRFTFEYWQPLAGSIPGDAAFEIYTTSTTAGDPDFYTTLAFGPTRKALFRRGHQVVTDVVETTPNGTTHVLEVPLSSIGDPSGFKFIAFLPGENNPSGPYPEMEKLDLVPNVGFGEIGTPSSPACSDGIDNDADSRIDFPADPGCTSATDTDEADPTPTPPGIPGGGGPGGVGTTDTVAPKLNLAGAGKTQDVDKLGLTLLLDEIADVTVTGSVGVPGASKVYRITKVTRRVAAGKRTRIGLKLSKKARKAIKKALKRGQKLKAKLTVTAQDLAGQRTVKRPSLKLKR